MHSKYIDYLSEEGAEKLLGEIIAKLDKEERNDRNNVFNGKPWREVLGYEPSGDAKSQLKTLIDILDDKDGDDYFSTWGWRSYFLGEE